MKDKNFPLMEQVRTLYNEGLSDGKIAKRLNHSISNVHYYRYYVLKLDAHQTKRNYQGDMDAKLIGYILRGVKSSAKRRKLEYNLTHTDIQLVTHCPLLGIELSYKVFLGKTNSNDLHHATVDRIDNSKGYVKGNIWILSRLANNMKSSASKEQLKLFATNILQRI